MRRVLVIGSGGSGKTTFARRLGQATRLPIIHLDSLYWRSGWQPTPDHEWDRVIAELIAGDEWIMDGNYGRTLPVRLGACDTVIFLDVPPWICLWRIIRRSWHYRGRERPDLPPGCPERLTWEFVWWAWTYRKRRRPGILRALSATRGRARVVVLRSTREAGRFLASVRASDDRGAGSASRSDVV